MAFGHTTVLPASRRLAIILATLCLVPRATAGAPISNRVRPTPCYLGGARSAVGYSTAVFRGGRGGGRHPTTMAGSSPPALPPLALGASGSSDVLVAGLADTEQVLEVHAIASSTSQEMCMSEQRVSSKRCGGASRTAFTRRMAGRPSQAPMPGCLLHCIQNRNGRQAIASSCAGVPELLLLP